MRSKQLNKLRGAKSTGKDHKGNGEVRLRDWEQDDAEFVSNVRNVPELQRWFRQDFHLTVLQQQFYIRDNPLYRGQIIELDGQPVGVCNVRADTREFGIAILPKYQNRGVATLAMKLLLQKFGDEGAIWSEVFVDNPALSWYLHKLGFKAVSVKERAYYKRGVGLIDVVRIEWGNA